jgi:CubicO group peptidase (beta-lactamase class C family)
MRHSLAAAGALSIALLTTTNAATPTARPEDVGVSSERIRRVAETVQRHIDAKDVAGAITLVARRGKIVEFEAQVSLARTSLRPRS